MRVIFFEIEDGELDFFKQQLPGHDLIFLPDKLNPQTIDKAQNADVVCVFVGSQVTEEVLKSIPTLKAVVTRSTGFDHIDSKYCEAHAIKLLTVPHYGVNTVAEHAIALILSLSRNIVKAANQTKLGNFTNTNLVGFDLSGKTLGIIGFGAIGGRVAEIAQGFKMKVLVFSRTPKDIPGIAWVNLEELLKQSDVITIHTPLTPETQHLLNRKNMELIKRGAILVNTARGPIIETEGLVYALESGILRGAGLDVLEEEQMIKDERQVLTQEHMDVNSLKTLLLDHILREFDNVIITPHNAFNSKEAVEEINTITATNILEALK